MSYTSAIPRIGLVVRRESRVKSSEPVRIRPANSHYSEENATTLDISRSGLSFESTANHYYVGMEVFVMRNVQPGDPANHEEHASVVRVEKMQNGKCRVAIRIISA
jgi:hypothetical protein